DYYCQSYDSSTYLLF
nr:immunoglobulin light chain junction region [Macaca mulatta]